MTNGTPRRKPTVLIVDDEPDIRALLTMVLSQDGMEPLAVESGEKALQQIRQRPPDVLLLDLMMPQMDGLEVLSEARKIDSTMAMIMLTGCTNISTAVEAIKAGASDYLTKPPDKTELLLRIRRALEMRRLRHENRALRLQMEREGTLRELMGPSPQVAQLMGEVERVAPTEFTVVITGETGSGKELIARAIHQQSHNAAGPFVPVDCGALQPNLIESELFGHERGAFTGADRSRPGRFEEASGGTLFLDEIQNVPLTVQTRFLRVLQERRFCRVGGTKMSEVDVRVVVASNEHLLDLIEEGKFRQDLYYRLSEFGIRVPPLRERGDDILHLVDRFMRLTAIELKRDQPVLSPEAEQRLRAYPWPGNVRELRNVIRKAVLMADAEIGVDHLGTVGTFALPTEAEGRPQFGEGQLSFKERVRQSVEQVERAILLEVLKQTGGNKAKAARLLQIDYKTISTKVRQYGIASQPGSGGARVEEVEELPQ